MFDISTAFLHAQLSSDDQIYVWPPKEFYPLGGVIWLLKKAMYGLRTAPRDWQVHFAAQLQSMGFTRMQSDANVYINFELVVIIFVYVDDLIVMGVKASVSKVFELLNQKFLIKRVGNLNDEGSVARFLGRRLKRIGDSIKFYMDLNFLEEDFEYYDLKRSRPVNTPGSSSIKRIIDGDEALDQKAHKRFRSTVGRLQWICPILPHINFAVKELARSLAGPTVECLAKLKHLLKFLKGATAWVSEIRPKDVVNKLKNENN